MKPDISYSEALQRLQKIAADLEAGNIGIDELESVIKESKTLLAFCEKKLRALGGKMEGMD